MRRKAQDDQNFVDAWKNGGKVDGKGVDDTRLLDHLKKRRDDLDPRRPHWDEWNNRLHAVRLQPSKSRRCR